MNKLFVAIFLLISISLSAQKYYNLTDKVVPYRKGNLWGYADKKTKEILVEPIYDSVNHDFLKRLRWITKVSKNGKWGLFAYNADNKNYELVVPIEYDSIVGIGDTYHRNNALWKNGRFTFLDEKFEKAFDQQDYFIDYFLENEYDFTAILKRENKNDVWYRQIVGGRPNAIVLDSIFKIDKIVNEMQYSNLKKETSVLFYQIIKKKKESNKSDERNYDKDVYVTTEPDQPKMYPLLFTNPNTGQQYIFYEYGEGKNKLGKFIKIPVTQLMKAEERIVHRKTSKKNQTLSKNIEFLVDNVNNNMKHRTKLNNQYMITKMFYNNIRLIQSPKTNKFGIARKEDPFLPDNVLAEPIYKSIIIYELSKYRKTFLLVLEKSNGKKNIFYLDKIHDIEFDELQVYQSELRYSNNKLKGIAFRNRELTFLPTKFIEIPEPIFKYNSTDFLKVFIPNNIYYYLSTDGLEFYEK